MIIRLTGLLPLIVSLAARRTASPINLLSLVTESAPCSGCSELNEGLQLHLDASLAFDPSSRSPARIPIWKNLAAGSKVKGLTGKSDSSVGSPNISWFSRPGTPGDGFALVSYNSLFNEGHIGQNMNFDLSQGLTIFFVGSFGNALDASLPRGNYCERFIEISGLSTDYSTSDMQEYIDNSIRLERNNVYNNLHVQLGFGDDAVLSLTKGGLFRSTFSASDEETAKTFIIKELEVDSKASSKRFKLTSFIALTPMIKTVFLGQSHPNFFHATPPTRFLTGTIGSVILYNRVLDEAEKSAVEQYLDTKYGLQSPAGFASTDFTLTKTGSPQTQADASTVATGITSSKKAEALTSTPTTLNKAVAALTPAPTTSNKAVALTSVPTTSNKAVALTSAPTSLPRDSVLFPTDSVSITSSLTKSYVSTALQIPKVESTIAFALVPTSGTSSSSLEPSLSDNNTVVYAAIGFSVGLLLGTGIFIRSFIRRRNDRPKSKHSQPYSNNQVHHFLHPRQSLEHDSRLGLRSPSIGKPKLHGSTNRLRLRDLGESSFGGSMASIATPTTVYTGYEFGFTEMKGATSPLALLRNGYDSQNQTSRSNLMQSFDVLPKPWSIQPSTAQNTSRGDTSIFPTTGYKSTQMTQMLMTTNSGFSQTGVTQSNIRRMNPITMVTSTMVANSKSKTRTKTNKTKTMVNLGRKELAYPAFLEVNLQKDFRTISKLGEGAFGSLFKAEIMSPTTRTLLGFDQVAIKYYKPPTGKSREDAVAEFQHEAAVVFLLQSTCTNIVKFVGCSMEPMAMVMKSYPVSLLDYIKNCQAFPTIRGSGKLLGLVLDMLNGLEAVHEYGLCHRDIKPGNMLLDFTEAGVTLVICDFGLARVLDDVLKQEVRGRRQVLADGLSYQYSSMEAYQIYKYNDKPDPEVMCAIDVFAWALTAFHLLTMDYPWGELGPDEVEHCLIEGQRPVFTLAQWGQDHLVMAVKGAIESAWVQDPLDRPSFTHLKDTLASQFSAS